MASHIERRKFLTALGGAAASWPFAARAQQPTMPTIGFFRSTVAVGSAHLVTAFRHGLTEAGFIEGQNVVIEYRWADDQHDRLPGLAADLVRRQVAVIVANGVATRAAKAATTAIPIVFVSGDDPVRTGFVARLNRPGGNITGISFLNIQLGAKRFGLLDELSPKTAVIAALLDPNAGYPELAEVEAAARAIDRRLLLMKARSRSDFDPAFATIVEAGAGALFVGGGAFFVSQRRQLVALAARHGIPAIYPVREFVEVGGLMSYGTSQVDAYRRAGIYVARILKGEKPGEMPIELPTKFDLVINLATARALGVEIPPTLLARADEVLE